MLDIFSSQNISIFISEIFRYYHEKQRKSDKNIANGFIKLHIEFFINTIIIDQNQLLNIHIWPVLFLFVTL